MENHTSLQLSKVKSDTPCFLKKSVTSSRIIGRWRSNSWEQPEHLKADSKKTQHIIGTTTRSEKEENETEGHSVRLKVLAMESAGQGGRRCWSRGCMWRWRWRWRWWRWGAHCALGGTPGDERRGGGRWLREEKPWRWGHVPVRVRWLAMELRF